MRKRLAARLLAPLMICSLSATACSTSSNRNKEATSASSPSVESTAVSEPSSAAVGDEKEQELGYIEEMDKNSVMTFEIKADPDEWQAMLDNATAKEYISADITINGTTIENVGIRPKGNSTLSSIARDDSTDRYSFKIKFDEFVDGQTWMGLDKMVLNSNYSDKTSMKEYLSYDIMSYINVEAPLFAYADISLNGETWGFYLAVEDYEGSYLDRATDGEGELYKPESMQMGEGGGKNEIKLNPDEMDAALENLPEGELPEMPDSAELPDGRPEQEDSRPDGIQGQQPPEGGMGRPENGGMGRGGDDAVALQYIDDEISSYSSIFDNAKTKTKEDDHQRVITALKNLSEGTNLETYIDVEGVLRYLAAHTTVVNLDSYSGGMAHNYVLYENDGQLNMLPWDYNMAFGGFQSGDAEQVANFPIDTPVSGVSMEERPMISKLLEVPEYMDLYHQYLQEIVDGYFGNGQFEKRVDEINAMIDEYVENDPTAFYTYEEYQTAVTELKKLGTLRGESIQGQLDGAIPTTTDGQKAGSSALLDASDIDMGLIGSDMGGPGRGGRGGESGFRTGAEVGSEGGLAERE